MLNNKIFLASGLICPIRLKMNLKNNPTNQMMIIMTISPRRIIYGKKDPKYSSKPIKKSFIFTAQSNKVASFHVSLF